MQVLDRVNCSIYMHGCSERSRYMTFIFGRMYSLLFFKSCYDAILRNENAPTNFPVKCIFLFHDLLIAWSIQEICHSITVLNRDDNYEYMT